ncbi:hypothetical protein KDA23_04160, partial [Candidatus Saccharibacteria bacterium]|nr:hypothetical protein [Candidatus Saccharibacteria bacterium]
MNYFQRLIAWITRDKSYRFYQVALQFLRAETIAEKRRVVEKHPGVLSNGMRVGGMLSWTEPAIENGDHELLGLLKKNEDLLRHLFEVGKRGVSVEQALEDYELPEQNLGLLNTLIGAKTAGEKIAVLEKHSHVLLTDAFEQVIAKMVKYAEQANEAETYVQMCEIQEMLRRCREIGTKEARVEFERREQDQSFEILMAFVQAGSQAEMRQLLQQHQGLASPRIELALEKMIDTARQSGDVKHVHLFSRAQMMLREARETRKKQKTGKKQKTEKKEAFATEPPEAQLAAAMRELSQPGKSNDEYIALYQRILSLISRESHGDLWGRFHCMLAHRLLQREIPAVGQVGAIHLNSLPDNIEDVIFHYEQALEALTNEAHPDMWREAHSNLGSFYTYSAMETGNSKHQELAIRHSQEVLNVVSFEELPREWAEFHNNLGLLFCSR